MSARHSKDDHAEPGRAVAALTWLGGGTVDDLEERSTAPLIGTLVLLGGVAAWSAATGAAAAATGWPPAVTLSATLMFAALVLAVIRSTVSSSRALPARIAVAVAVGIVLGELSAMAVFGNAVTDRLQQQAAQHAATAPAVTSATADLDAQRAARKSLDDAVGAARQRRDAAQVVARCEYQPAPSCPQQDITGVAGDGQITQNTQDVLDQNQQELDAALVIRDQQGPALDARIADAEHTTALARQAAIAGADRGFGARWVAMNAYTLSTAMVLVLRVLLTACCILLYLLPLLLHTRADRTLRERHHQSRLRADLEAETAIAVKRAEARAAAEVLQAEHQLANMRMALEAETAINREYHRQRVADAQVAGAAELAVSQSPSGPKQIEAVDTPETVALSAIPTPATVANLPVPASAAVAAKSQAGPSIPLLPDIAGAAARFLRPFVPPVITQAVENSTQQLRSAQKVFEEFEEFTFAFRRTTRVTVQEAELQTGADPVPTPENSPTVIDAAVDPRELTAARRAIEH